MSGVAEFSQSIADRLAEAGYAAVAMHLFHRVTDDMTADGTAKNAFLSDPQIIVDVNATVDWLRAHPAIDGERIWVTGCCTGGRIAQEINVGQLLGDQEPLVRTKPPGQTWQGP